MAAIIRLVTDADAPAVQAIYAPIVRDTPSSFELLAPSAADIAQRIAKTLLRFPWLVCEQDGTVLGYAYASLHRERAAYQWSVDVSVYVHEQHRGQGIGRALYTSLFAILRAQGFYNVYAGITLPNHGSVALHEAMGMQPLGVYRHVGYKLGAWHDVGWWQGMVQPMAEQPVPPQPVTAIQGTEVWDSLLARGLSHLHLA